MMLDREAIIEAQFVAKLELAPKLLVALRRAHAGLAPDVGEVGKLHGVFLFPMSLRSTANVLWGALRPGDQHVVANRPRREIPVEPPEWRRYRSLGPGRELSGAQRQSRGQGRGRRALHQIGGCGRLCRGALDS